MKYFAITFFAVLCLAATSSPLSAQTDPALAKQAYQILDKYCYKCHGLEKRSFDALNHDSMVKGSYVVPNDLESSYLWTKVGIERDMPPKKSGIVLSDSELDVVKRWIETGAEFPPPARARDTLDERYILTHINNHLETKIVDETLFKHQRYFSLAHLHNNQNVTDYQLRLYRAALAKVINSLHREPNLVLPATVDPNQVIYSIDLRDVGWRDPTQFLQVLQEYPFGISHSDGDLSQLEEKVNKKLGGGSAIRNPIAYLRADWFIAKASRPPLYDTLLALPDTEAKLQEELGVKFVQDFTEDRLLRAAFTQSGVSRRNRLVDRLVGRFGYYYRSDDFGNASDRAVLPRFPLGPRGAFPKDQHPFDNEAYVPDGGEIVFRLPNGLQGYMIVDTAGKRLPEAPVNIVRDLTEISGSPAVVNGVSCMGCHDRGIKLFEDDVRETVRLSDSKASQKLNRLFRTPQMQAALQADTNSFMAAMEACIAPFLKQGEDAGKDLRAFPEPIKEAVHLYDSGVSAEIAACELGINKDEFRSSLRGNELQVLGLGPLLRKDKSGGENKIPRDVWDSKDDNGSSVFQVVARILGIGIGTNIPKGPN